MTHLSNEAKMATAIIRDQVENVDQCPFCDADRFSYSYNAHTYGYDAKFLCGLVLQVKSAIQVPRSYCTGATSEDDQHDWCMVQNVSARAEAGAKYIARPLNQNFLQTIRQDRGVSSTPPTNSRKA